MRIIFVADNFADKFIGGAELSIQTHINSCPLKFTQVRSKEFNPKKFNPKKDLLFFGNFFEIDRAFLPMIGLMGFRYAVEECDYKYCIYRSSHKHKAFSGKECDCHKTEYGINIYNFFCRASHLFWKSEGQRDEYANLFGMIPSGTIMGGVFSDADIDYILSLKDTPTDEKYYVLYSNSWIKGHQKTLEYCRAHKLPYREVGNIPYKESLQLLAKSKGIVYFPNGFDVSCRMITEAKLLGREIITSDLVQHTKEAWFNGTQEERIAFLRSRDKEFWRIMTAIADGKTNNETIPFTA